MNKIVDEESELNSHTCTPLTNANNGHGITKSCYVALDKVTNTFTANAKGNNKLIADEQNNWVKSLLISRGCFCDCFSLCLLALSTWFIIITIGTAIHFKKGQLAKVLSESYNKSTLL